MKLSVVVPAYNEESTLRRCAQRVLEIGDESLALEIIIVDDCSTDRTLDVARILEAEYPAVSVLHRPCNEGKGSAVWAGLQRATGDFIAVQDADLEYDPQDLRRMLVPLIEDKADVVFGSRFLAVGAHRVLYFWHYLGNYFLTSLSNMFTDLNMTDMESGYKVFRQDVLRGIRIEEKRFGFEPEIVAKVAQLRPRIFEVGISYYGRTYEEGKKIGFKDGLRALYCIFKYNAPKAPWPLHLLVYLLFGGFAVAADLVLFFLLMRSGLGLLLSSVSSFIPALAINYFLSAHVAFRKNSRWRSLVEVAILGAGGSIGLSVDLVVTGALLVHGFSPGASKLLAFALTTILYFPFLGLVVFPEPAAGPWRPQESPRINPTDFENPSAAAS